VTRRREFNDQAQLKVYLEAADKVRLTERAKENGRLVTEYVRELILADLDTAEIPEVEYHPPVPSPIGSPEMPRPASFSVVEHDPRCPCDRCRRKK